jgi:hypothetical protein
MKRKSKPHYSMAVAAILFVLKAVHSQDWLSYESRAGKNSGVKPLPHKGGPPRRAAVTQALVQEVETLLRQVAALLQ